MRATYTLQHLFAPTACLAIVSSLTFWDQAFAYSRYRNSQTGSGNCFACHGEFTGNQSTKGSIFPSGNKHEMHRASTSMAAACNLCHTSGDNRNPFIGSSAGTANNSGLGCVGCHVGPGLRAHHAANGVGVCADCHDGDAAVPENLKPPYYGTADTKVNNPANLVKVSNTNENWTVGDFVGLDNDGNNLYDAADLACWPYQVIQALPEGNNVRVSWQTAGGRTDVVQASTNPTGPYTSVIGPVAITGVGITTTNWVELGGATNRTRFYRVKYQP